MGARTGIGVDIDAAVAGGVNAAELTVCWDNACRTSPINLFPSTRTVTEGCEEGVCSARQVPTGGKHGFVDIRDLPVNPVDVTLSMTDLRGSKVVAQTLSLTPKPSYPNGPDCGAGGPAAGITVDANATARSTD